MLDVAAVAESILGRPESSVMARPLPIAADRLLEQADGPVLMIVEAPMGEGKTELALLAHLRLQARHGHRGLYLALPTQATGNAMFDRTLAFLRQLAPGVQLDIQLVHGATRLDERIQRLRGVDAYVLYCTWGVLLHEPVWRLPEDIDRLVQAVYSGDPFEEDDRPDFLATLDKALGEHYAKTQTQRQQAFNVAIDAEDEPQNAYNQKPRANEDREGGGISVVTRLGEESLTVVPILISDDGWRLTDSDGPFDPTEIPDDALARRLFARQVRLSRKGILHDLLALPLPRGFEEHPLLQHLRPLPLIDGRADCVRRS